LMRVSAEAVKELCAKKRHLGGLPGILSVRKRPPQPFLTTGLC
jgi:hypothetical protein